MKNYTDDPQLRTLRDVISDPKNKLNKIKFAKGALYKDSIHIHPTNDSIDKKNIKQSWQYFQVKN